MKHLKWLILSIILLIPALPMFNSYIFGWIAFTPFFIVLFITKKKIRVSFIYGILLGSTLYGFVLMMNEGTIFLKLFTFLALIILQGILFAVYGFLISFIDRNVKGIVKKQVSNAVAWVITEFVFLKLFFGAITYPGITQHTNFSILPLAKYIGLYGISFLVILANIYLADLFITFRDRKRIHTNYLGVPLIFIIVLIITVLNPNLHKEFIQEKDEINVSIVQANISTYDYLDALKYPVKMKKIFDKYIDMSYKVFKNYDPDIIVWPETAVHRWMMQLPEYRNELYKIAKRKKVYIMFGTPDLTVSDKEYNSVYVISPKGNVLGKYSKSKLIPYWEQAFIPGRIIKPVNTERFTAGINICSEIFFPEIAALQVKKGANILFLHSNNGMLGYTLAPYFSSAFSVFRAVENRVYVVQSMNTGISQIVSPTGNVLIKSELFNEEIINYRVPIVESEGTFYTRYGEFTYLLITIFFIIYILYLKYFKVMILRAFNINKN